MLRSIARTAGRVGLGIVAGAAGTAVMTLAQKIEMGVTGRKPSTMPADAADEVADLAPESEEKRQRFANVVHWSCGTAWGALRGLLGSTPMSAVAADIAFLSVVWVTPMIYLPALDLAEPAKEWGAKQLAVDLGHHLIYATAVVLAWRALVSENPAD